MAVMIDLETLGLHPGCVVLSIGAIRFDRTGDIPEIVTVDEQPGIPGSFYEVIDTDDCLSHGLVVDPKIRKWWDGQDQQARDAVFAVPGAPLKQVAEGFAEWFTNPGETVWGNGASFDQPIWDAACRAVGLEPPWHFRKIRDCRTLFDLAYPGSRPPAAGDSYPPHHALFDCYRQVCKVQSCFRKLGLADPAGR